MAARLLLRFDVGIRTRQIKAFALETDCPFLPSSGRAGPTFALDEAASVCLGSLDATCIFLVHLNSNDSCFEILLGVLSPLGWDQCEQDEINARPTGSFCFAITVIPGHWQAG